MLDGVLDNSKHPKWKTFLYYAMFICLMLAGFLMVFSLRNKAAEAPNASEDGTLGDVTPQILVGDTIYYWAGMSLEYSGAGTPGAQVNSPGDGSTILPEGFTEYGAFLTTIDTPPTEELQLQADFSAFGTVYRNSEVPEVIYILMTTDWFRDSYVRFASTKILDGERIFWNGNHYRAGFTDGTATMLDALPKDAVSIGNLHYIGLDRIPEKDLETNCLCDNHACSLEGREVFADPDEPKYLYVYADRYWAGGSSSVYWKCPLW